MLITKSIAPFAFASLLGLFSTGPAWAQSTAAPAATTQTAEGPAALIGGAPELAAIETLDPAVLERISILLSGYEFFPTSEDLLGVTADPVPYLLAIAYDPQRRWLPSHHNRAVDALAFFSTELSRVHLVYLLHSENTPVLLRHHVMNSLALAFGEQVLPEIQPFLASNDVQLRLTAASALSVIPSTRSIEILESALTGETDPVVRQRIEEILAQPPLDREVRPD